MAAMEWDEPGMKRNKNVRFRMGQGSNTVSYYPPQSALEVGRNPSGYNPNQLLAVRQPGALSVVSRGAFPSVVPPQTGFQMGVGSPIEVNSVARPATPQLQIGYDPIEQITSEEVQRNLGKNRPRSSTPVSEGTAPKASFKSMGPFNSNMRVSGGSHVIDPSGSLAGELYRRLSKSTGRYIPGLEQMWGGQPNADEWRQGIDEFYQQARSGLKVHPMTTSRAAGIPALPTQQPDPVLSKFSNGMDATPENAQRAIELGLPGAVAANEAMNPPKPVYGQTIGSAIIKDAATGKVLAQGSGTATGGFGRNEESRLKDVAAEEARVNNFWADAAKQRSMETSDRQNSMMTQLDSAIRSGNQEQAAMLTNALKGVGAIQPMNYGAIENQLAEARTRQAALPYVAPSQEAENRFKNAQAGYYSGKNEAETRAAIAQSRASALARVLAANKQEKDYLQDPTKLKALSDVKAMDPELYAQFMANR